MSQVVQEVRVRQTEAEVYGVWEIILTGRSGVTPPIGDTVSFSISGASGIVLGFTVTTQELLKIYIPGGAGTAQPSTPADGGGGGETITGTGWSATYGNPVTRPQFDLDVAAGDVFTVQSSGVAYVVGSIDQPSRISLTGNYLGADADLATGLIGNGVTPTYGFPFPNLGDRDQEVIVQQMIIALENHLAGLSSSPVGSLVQPTLTSPWTEASAVRYYKDRERVFFKGAINTATSVDQGDPIISGANVLPSGFRPAENQDFSLTGNYIVRVGTDGSLTFQGGDGFTGDIWLDQISYRADGS